MALSQNIGPTDFPGDSVEKIKFFTAKVDPQADPDNPTPKQRRQEIYWKALKAQGVEVIEGLLAPRPRTCQAQCGGTYRTMSEKMSDVNLALHAYRDFIDCAPDVICIVSADLDVIPAVQMIRNHAMRVAIFIYLPTQDDSLYFSRKPEHQKLAITRQLSDTHVRKARLADEIEVEPGLRIRCPDTWLPPKKIELPPHMYQ